MRGASGAMQRGVLRRPRQALLFVAFFFS